MKRTLRILRSLAIFAVSLVVLLVAVFIFLINFQSSESAFRCEGKLTMEGDEKPATIFMILHEYWLAKLWSNSDGELEIQAPKANIPIDHFFHVQNVGDQIRHVYRDEKDSRLSGGYYKLSRHLMLDTHQGFFEGDCVPIED